WEQSPAAQPGGQQTAPQGSQQSARSAQQPTSTTWTPAVGQAGQAGQGTPAQPGQQAQTARATQAAASHQSTAASYTQQPTAPASHTPAAQAPATQTPAAYWAQRPDTPASPVARRRGGESPLARSAATAAQAARTPGLDDDEPLAEETRRPVPRYGFKGMVYRTLHVNLGPSRRDLDELDIRERLNRQTRRTRGYCGYIGIASEKGGVGKTTLASLLAAEIAEGRRESVGIADLNPDLGTLPDRFGVRPHYSIRDLLAHVDEIPWRYHVHDFMEKVPEMNVRVLAASTDRKIRHQLSVADVELLAELFAPFFSFAIFDNGTHITHEAMLGTLRTAHGMVLVTDNTRDGANLARKTLQFLSDNGFPEMRRRVVLSVVAKETASPIKVRAIEKAFRDHVRDLIVVPYDPALDGGGKIPFRDPNAVNKILRKETRMAVRRLAAVIMDDLVA
ncbi:MAG TPA: hypothetical protein VI076_09210, partial [Actinopolymorphaceae bacterium]